MLAPTPAIGDLGPPGAARLSDARASLVEAHAWVAAWRVAKWIRRGVRDFEEVESVAYAATVEAGLSWDPDRGASFISHVRKVVDRRVIDSLRRAQRRGPAERLDGRTADGVRGVESGDGDGAPGADAAAVRGMRVSDFETVTPAQGEALELYVRGLSRSQIAAALGLSDRAAGARLDRALAAARAELEAMGVGPGGGS